MNLRQSVRTGLAHARDSWTRGVRFMVHRLITPISPDEDSRRKEFVLNIILVSSIILLFLLDISLVISAIHHGTSYDGIPFESLLGCIVLLSTLLLMSRRGHHEAASYILLAIYFSLTMYGVATWSFVLPMIILGAILIIVISSILIGTRFGFIMTGLIASTTMIITWLQVRGLIPVELYWRKDPLQVGDAVEISIIFLLIAGISWLSNREMESSLKRARRSEQLLAQERNELEIRVEERTQELKNQQAQQIDQLSRFAELGQLSSSIFHDLMNPLNAIVATISQLEPGSETRALNDSVERAVLASRKMGAFLQTARKQIRPAGNPEYFSATKELAEAVDLLRHKARLAEVSLSFNPAQEFFLTGIPLKFHQIGLNLIANAIESYDASSSNRTVHISLLKRDKVLLLKVTDHGCGIAPSHLSHIFSPFFTTKPGGTGLGLATVKTTVESNFGGTISVQSNPDGGTSFSASFPLS